MITIRALITMGIGLLITSTTVFAVPFTPVLDEFWIYKSGSEIFRDTFGNNMPPPNGPDGATTYLIVGPGGITSEAGNKLTMTPSLGEQVLISATLADVSTAGLRRLATGTGNENILDQASSFEIHGLFDLSSLPMITGQSFGVRANDRAPDIGYLGNNTFYLFVGVSSMTGDVSIFLRINDFSLDTSDVLWAESIQSALTGADQIELVLTKEAVSNQLNASYSIFDYDLSTTLVKSGEILNAGALYQPELVDPNNPNSGFKDPEPFVRAQFISTDRVTVPEPATLSLLGLGLLGIPFMRRRKTPA